MHGIIKEEWEDISKELRLILKNENSRRLNEVINNNDNKISHWCIYVFCVQTLNLYVCKVTI